MKLISLYIENFGGLSRYSLDFSQGLTVVQEPNGFGKTTLAEFIRAMFYGFPRKGKTLDKSKRQKYTPWQGGVYGGNLVFSLDGTRYRIERTFGATPKGDSFALIDLDTGKKSDRFSEEIGLELFRLDADSFERSTYLPQLHDSGPLTTNNIQAKLADLVEDPGDVGNYDKAVAALKNARSSFIPYRGSGGTVAEARSNISRLQTELEQLNQTEASLTALRESVSRLEQEQAELEQQKILLRRRLDVATEADSIAAVHRDYRRLADREQQLQSAIEELERRYPKGVPSPEVMTGIRQIAADRAVLAGQTVTTREDEAAQAYVKENDGRFAGHVPTQEELENCREAISDYQTLQAEADATGLSDAEKRQYESLLPLFESGALEESHLAHLDDTNRELTQRRHKLDGLQFPDTAQLEALTVYFAPGIPDENTLESKRQQLAQANALRREAPKQKITPAQILLWVLAAAGIGAGIWLIVSRMTLYGCIGLGVGAAALIGALILLLRKDHTAEQQAAALEQEVANFASRYTETIPLSDALYEIRDKLDDYRKLHSARQELDGRKAALSGEIAQLEAALKAALPGNPADFDKAILGLHLARSQFLDLREELTQAEEKIASLDRKITERRAQVSAFLSGYFPSPQPEQFHPLLSQLQRDSEHYLRCRERIAAWQQRRTEHDSRMARYEAKLTDFFTCFALTRQPNLREQLLQIRDDSFAHLDALQDRRQLRAELEEFTRANQKVLETHLPDTREDVAVLRGEEQQLSDRINDVREQLLTLRDRQRHTEEQLLQIPQLRDELELWQERFAAHREKADILDSTLDFLEKARENLQTSYLGPVKQRFQHYMQRLPGEQPEQILLSPDLEVQLERFGRAREIGYFSAGQTDMVMLCMRLALVDALFPEERPFVILDDPFVNLDDAHTAEALKLLQEIAEEKQILYLVCNSSRAIS